MTLRRYTACSLYRRPYVLVLCAAPVAAAVVGRLQVVALVAALLAGVLYLSTFWTVRSELFQCYRPDPRGAHILHDGELCRIATEQHGSATHRVFYAQRSKFLVTEDSATRIVPRTDFTLLEYTKGTSQRHYALFPHNEIRVPTPSFLRLFKEQCVTPLFCFQIFSSLLMCFDDYVLQSLFSTAMIVFVEAALVFSRVATIAQFRTLENKGCSVEMCEKDDGAVCDMEKPPSTSAVDSTLIRPSDILRIAQPMDVPCDLLILRGSCAVNEAMLSGESVPLLKEQVMPSTEAFDFKRHRRHVLFGGTRIEKIDSPVFCVALRTAFDTEQGMLLNTMLASEDIKYDPEALRFILMLSGLSLLSSIFTFFFSKKTGYPLFIDIVVLFTNSIPFELPMEMGVSVQGAVKRLAAKGIHCLEPFRITLAGKVNVCCFDKTGTLTESALAVHRVLSGDSNTSRILQCCHSLVDVDGEQRGDPLDEALLRHVPVQERVPHSVVKQFQYSSELKRQSVISDFSDGTRLFAMKGAPETVKRFLGTVPADYDEYQKHAAEGDRVIALACKVLDKGSVSSQQSHYEHGLAFSGFVLLGSKLRDHAVEMCRTLTASDHRVLVITGDNLLTATAIAGQLGIEPRGAEGADIDRILSDEDFFNIRVFARAEPKHKELIIKKYRRSGFYTMMVGDGTNDVGALKAADVGIAMLEGVCAKSCKNSSGSLNAILGEAPPIKPGDASVAAPFTVRSNSLRAVVEIIQQGRSSLVTTIQMYKILALNSVTNAFFLSFIDIIGVKFSEYQMVAAGVLSAMAFQAISSGRPLPSISRQRPLTTIFSRYILGSIAGQSAVHIGAFVAVSRWIPAAVFAEKFKPSVMNTVLFVISCVQTISTFSCNYIGRPFRENISENMLMVLSLFGLLGFVLNVILNVHAELNGILEVVPLGGHICSLLAILCADALLSYAVEKVCFRLFMLK